MFITDFKEIHFRLYFFYRIACDPGYFSLGAQESCTLCAEGEYCATTIESGIPCGNVGEYSEAGSTNCTTCEAGFYCPNFRGEVLEQVSEINLESGFKKLLSFSYYQMLEKIIIVCQTSCHVVYFFSFI